MADDLLVIIPTRGRPQAVPALTNAWRETSATADLLFVCDTDDPMANGYRDEFENLRFRPHGERPAFFWTDYWGPRKRLCGSLNAAALTHAADYRYLAFMGDDHRPRPAAMPWDARIRECLSAGPGLVYGNDLLQGEEMPTAVAMTSDIVRTLGYMAPPTLTHLCLDLVWRDWGRGTGRITYLHDMVIEHLHPAAGKAKLDAGYEECNSEQQVTADATAYYAYRDGGGLAADLDRLRALIIADRYAVACGSSEPVLPSSTAL
jgi:hypothetical protein